MGKHFVCGLSLLLVFAPQLRADITLTNGSAAAFESAVEDTKTAGGGTITFTSPVSIGSADDTSSDDFDGESMVVLSGGTNSMFLVQGSLALTGFTLQNGTSTNGGAIYITADGDLTASNCIFAGNIARGADGNSTTGTNNVGSSNEITAPVSGGLPAMGGAIFNLGSAAFFNCQFLTNSAIGGAGGDAGTGGGNGGAGASGGAARGGAIYSEGLLTLVNSTFAGNLATGGNGGANTGVSFGSGGIGGSSEGAGLFSAGAPDTNTVLNCTFSQNIASGGVSGNGGTTPAGMGRAGRNGGSAFGGGIDNASAMVLTNCTFFENNAVGGGGGNGGDGGGRGGGGGIGGNAVGGGLYNTGMVSVVNCTFSKSGALGGTNGLGGSGIVSGRNGSRGNSRGGNIANVAKKKFGSFHLENSIVGVGLAGNAGYGTIIDDDFNISADKSIKLKKANNSFPKTDPLIGDLADNGGPTETIALAPGSPAIDKINPTNAPDIDQRGFFRPQPTNGLSDIGAYELDLNSARILTQPKSATVTVGSNVTFTVTAAGATNLVYQWFTTGSTTNFANGLTNSSLIITNVQLTNAGSFHVVVSNSFNSVTSAVVTLTVNAVSNFPPVITLQPQSQTVASNATASFSVTASGTAPLFYQWVFVGSSFIPAAIPGATNTTLTITNVQTTNQGLYFANVTNNFGSTNSQSATLLISTNSGGGSLTPPGAAQSSALAAPQEPHLMPLTASQNGDAPATVNVAFPSQADIPYVIEYKKTLTDSVWIPIATNIGSGDWLTNRMPTTSQPSGFYRVRSP
jgi:hypothetical protein